MSNRPTLSKITKNGMLQFASIFGWNWYVLKDRSGHIRDWCPAINAKFARKRFAKCRPNGILPGYRVERRGKVEHE